MPLLRVPRSSWTRSLPHARLRQQSSRRLKWREAIPWLWGGSSVAEAMMANSEHWLKTTSYKGVCHRKTFIFADHFGGRPSYDFGGWEVGEQKRIKKRQQKHLPLHHVVTFVSQTELLQVLRHDPPWHPWLLLVLPAKQRTRPCYVGHPEASGL